MINPALLSSKDHTWQTPEHMLESVRAVGPIALDPCGATSNPTRAREFYCPGAPTSAPGIWRGADGLAAEWPVGPDEVVFVNPPYGSALPYWMKKCSEQALRHRSTIVALTPSRTGAAWWQSAHKTAHMTVLLKGRLKFLNADPAAPSPDKMWSERSGGWVDVTSAAFPSSLFLWTSAPGAAGRFRAAFSPAGIVL